MILRAQGRNIPDDSQSLPPEKRALQFAAEGAQHLITGIEGVRDRVRRVTDFVANTADVVSGVSPAAAKLINLARDTRLIEKVNIRTLPPLLNDSAEDLLLKAQILDHLDSPIAASLPFVEVIETIGKACFDRGVKPENLSEFFSNYQILAMMVDNTVVQDRISYRANNLVSTGSSVVEGLMAHVRFKFEGLTKDKVDAKTAAELKRYIAFFKKKYDPKDLGNTFTQFIQRLEEKYPKYDIRGWLRENKELLTAVIYDPEDPQSHVSEIVDEVYLNRGKSCPAEFISMFADSVVEVKKASSVVIRKDIAKVRGCASEKISKDQQYISVKIGKLKDLFEETFIQLATKDRSPKDVQALLIKLCLEKLSTQTSPLPVVFEMERGSTRVVDGFKDIYGMWNAVESEIRANTRTLSSHIDVLNLLSEPEEVPEEITSLYLELFDPQTGEIHEEKYNNYLKSLFGAVRKGRRERITTVKPKVEGILQTVTDYFTSLCDQLGLDMSTINPDILNNNNYAELIKICATAKDPRERFIARLKLELAAIEYSCEATPRKVYQDHDAEAISEFFQQATPGIRIKKGEAIREVIFYEDQNGNIFDSNEGRDDLVERKIRLMPAKFGDVNCYLWVNENGEFMSKKSLFSMMTKLIHRDRRRAKDLTDLLRMTILCENQEDIDKINSMLETNYLTFGRKLKSERVNGGKKNTGVKTNGSKSDQFKVDAFVADVPVEDLDLEGVYFAPVEVMVTDLERLKLQNTENNGVGHKPYELRRIRKIMSRLLPPELFPEYYEVCEPDPDDISGMLTVKLRTNVPKAR